MKATGFISTGNILPELYELKSIFGVIGIGNGELSGTVGGRSSGTLPSADSVSASVATENNRNGKARECITKKKNG